MSLQTNQSNAQEPDPLIASLTGIIAQYDREFDKWKKRSKKIIERYRDDNRSANNGGASVRFNILWSNVQTLVPATFARLPEPDVSRLFLDNDPVGRVAALILERALKYEIGHYPDYAASMRQCVFDRFLGGRGTSWVRYEPHFKAAQSGLPTDGVEISEDIDEPGEELDYECSPVDYVHWEDFGHSVARTWEEVTHVWRVVYLNEDAVEERFGEEMAKEIPYDSSPEKKERAVSGEKNPKQAKIYEIWDKDKKRAYWYSKSLTKIIDQRDDPLGLSEFWPCPKPLFATITNETLVPVPDYTLYQDQARDLDVLSDRIDGLIKAMQVKGVYDASVPELARLFTEGGNTDLIPVKNYQAFSEKNGLRGAIDIVDLSPFADALKQCYLAFSQVKEYIYEITGISDIVRGQTNPNETLGAQQIKQNFVGLRLKDMQHGVAKFCAEAICIKGQIICAKYSPETILRISAAEQLSESDKPLIPQAMALLIGPERMANPEASQGPNPTREFRIDIESDSLVEMDEATNKQDRLEFLKATGAFIKEAFPVIQASPAAAPLLVAMLKFGVTAFKVGRTIEGDFDLALDQLKQQAAQPQQPKPDPEMERVKADTQIQQARVQADQQTNQMKMQAAQQETQVKMQADAQMEQMRMQAESERHMRELQANAAESQRTAAMQQDTELKKAALQIAGQIEVARITSAAQERAAARNAEVESENEAKESAESEAKEQAGAQTQEVMNRLLETQAELLKTMSLPKQVMRDGEGRIIGMQVVK